MEPEQQDLFAASAAPAVARKPPPAASRDAAVSDRQLASCYGFAKGFLGLPVYDGRQPRPKESRACRSADGRVFYTVQEDTDWQKQVFDAIDRPGSRTTLRTANGSGKTSTIISGAILWHLALFPNSTVISTAGVDRQVRAQLFPNLRRNASRLKGWDFQDGSLTISAPNGSRYIGFTTDKPERAEGWHGKDVEKLGNLAASTTGPLMIIVDEAKGVPQGIFEAFDRCTFQRIIYASSPGLSDGEFYRSQTASNYPMRRFVIPAHLCPHADHAKNAETILKRGLDHPLVRSAIFAEFMSNEEGYVLTSADLDRCLANPPEFRPGVRRAFCDFAAGGDENVLALREGNRVRIVDSWRERDTMSALSRFIKHFHTLGLSPEQIAADGDGLGAPMLDRLAEMGWPLVRFRNGTAAEAPGEFHNFGAETWFRGAEGIKRGEFILDVDDETRAQLLGRRFNATDKGKLAVERKEDMRSRGLASPDRADALLAVMRPPVATAPIEFLGSSSDSLHADGHVAWAESHRDEYDDGRDLAAFGAHCG